MTGLTGPGPGPVPHSAVSHGSRVLISVFNWGCKMKRTTGNKFSLTRTLGEYFDAHAWGGRLGAWFHFFF